jgi:hypothetical protein
MKTSVYFLLTLILVSIPNIGMAYPGEYPWDPIHVKIEETQQTKNPNTEAILKNQYGVSAFYDCYSCTGMDTSDPHTLARCLSATKYCLERKEMFNINNLGSGDIPQSVIEEAVSLLGGEISESSDTICQNDYGQYSYWIETDNRCGCLVGSIWDKDIGKCIKEQTCTYPNILENGICVTPTEICTRNYGEHSYFTGNYDKNNQIFCDCQDGYTWESQYCVLEKVKTLPVPAKTTTKPQNIIIQDTTKDPFDANREAITKLDEIQTTSTMEPIEKKEGHFDESSVNSSTEEIKRSTNLINNMLYKIKRWLLELFR